MSELAKTRESYHHGDLAAALVAEGATLLAEGGIDGFSMRNVARRTGVSVAAPSHHFGNAKGLLTAIATEGFAQLERQLEVAAADTVDPIGRVVAMCSAYVDMTKSHPGHAAVMFRLDAIDETDQCFRKHSMRAFDLLKSALTRAAPESASASGLSLGAKTLWAAMHGIAALQMIEGEEADELVRYAVNTLLAGMR